MSIPNQTWHCEVIPSSAEKALESLKSVTLVPAFYLAGGTGLALHLGHRRSIDLDFFSAESIDEEALLRDLSKLRELSVIAKGKQTLELHLCNTKVGFMSYPYPQLFPLEPFLDIEVADPRDIACMKMSAIAGRGSKRDFIDLYAVSKKYPLSDLLGLFIQKYRQVDYNVVHILKSLTFFEDAEKEPLPDILVDISWDEVKSYFIREVPTLL
jgi:hypothetical protein